MLIQSWRSLIVQQPYLHESRHKHAMRRPRGPGGRFLTAEEIAAQKIMQGEESPGNGHSPSHEHNEELESDHLRAPVMMNDNNMSLPNDAYQDAGSLANALSLNNVHASIPTSHTQNMHSSNTAMGMHPTQYSAIPHMHLPSQTRMQHYSTGIYTGADAIDESEMRRRTEEMIHYGTRSGVSGS